MRSVNIILGAVVVLLGLLPLLEGVKALPEVLDVIPREGVIYNLIIVLAGVIIIVNSSKEKRIRLR